MQKEVCVTTNLNNVDKGEKNVFKKVAAAKKDFTIQQVSVFLRMEMNNTVNVELREKKVRFSYL